MSSNTTPNEMSRDQRLGRVTAAGTLGSCIACMRDLRLGQVVVLAKDGLRHMQCDLVAPEANECPGCEEVSGALKPCPRCGVECCAYCMHHKHALAAARAGADFVDPFEEELQVLCEACDKPLEEGHVVIYQGRGHGFMHVACDGVDVVVPGREDA